MAKTKKDATRCAIYIRTSSEESNDLSPKMQEERCRAAAKARGWSVGRIYGNMRGADIGLTGATLNRPALIELLRDGRAGDWDVLLVYRVDRLSRRLVDLCDVMDWLTDQGRDFASASEPFDTSTPFGRAMPQMLGVFAEMERETIKDRTMGPRMSAADNARRLQAAAPYGFRWQNSTKTERGRPIVDEAEAVIVKRIFRTLAFERTSANALAQILREEGVPPPGVRLGNGKPKAQTVPGSNGKRKANWTGLAVANIVRNRWYIAEAVSPTFYRMERQPKQLIDKLVDGEGVPDRKKARRWRDDNGKREVIAGGVPMPKELQPPPLIDKRTFERANKALKRNQRESGKRQFAYGLRGHVFCKVCGYRLVGNTTRGRYSYYRHDSRGLYARAPEDRCPGNCIPARELERQIMEHVAQAFSDRAVIERHILGTDDRKRQAWQAEIQRIETRIARAERARERCVRQYAWADDEDMALLEAERKDIVADLADLERQRANVRQLLDEEQTRKELAGHIDAVVDRLRGRVQEMTPDDVQRIADLLDLEIVVPIDDGPIEVKSTFGILTQQTRTSRGTRGQDSAVSDSRSGRSPRSKSLSLPRAGSKGGDSRTT